jgi:hypothetical protein
MEKLIVEIVNIAFNVGVLEHRIIEFEFTLDAALRRIKEAHTEVLELKKHAFNMYLDCPIKEHDNYGTINSALEEVLTRIHNINTIHLI